MGLLRFLQNLNDDAIMPSRGIEPLYVRMSLDLKSSPDPSHNHGGPLAHIRVVTSTPLSPGAVVPEPCLGCPPKNSLGRCARKLWGPAVEQGSLEGCVLKNASGCCARKLAFAGGSLHAEASNASRFPNECSPLAAHFLTRKLTPPNGLRIKRIRLPIADWRLRNVIRTQKDGNYPDITSHLFALQLHPSATSVPLIGPLESILIYFVY